MEIKNPPKPEGFEEQDAREDKIFRKVMDVHLREVSKEILRDMETERLLKEAVTEYEDQRCAEIIEKYKDFEPEEPLPPFEEFMKKVEARQAAQEAKERG